MRYTYEICDSQSNDRIEICTRYEEVEKYIPSTIYVKVFDNANLSKYPIETLISKDDHIGWLEKLARDSSWKPEKYSVNDTLDERKRKVTQNFINSTANLPDANAKTAAAVGKPQFSGIPPIAIMALGAAMQDGVNKYGRFNWRDSSVTSSVFYDAILRHLLAWYSGEREASDSGIHHLAHAMAGCAILLDAEYNLKLNDDRKNGKKVVSESLGWIKK